MHRTTLGAAVVAAATLVGVAPATAQPANAEEPTYAPVDQPGPALSVPADALAASLDCPTPVTPGSEPVVLIHGTNLDPDANFSWNYVPAFEAAGRTYCTVALPVAGMGDIQLAAEHVVHAVRTVAAAAHGAVDIVGYSQGGMIGRWALRFWPDTRPLVDDLVGLASSNHGTETAKPGCLQACAPSYHQQRSDSAFTAALNSIQEAFPGVDYTVAYTWGDEIVTPNVGPTASSPVRGEGSIANIALQAVCPGHAADHVTIGTTDAVAYAIVVDALDHDGPADASRLDPTVCAAAFMPGVDPTTLPADLAGFSARIDEANREVEPVADEPPLRCYVTASCAAAPTAGDEASAGPPTPTGTLRTAAPLPATGGGASATALAGVALALATALRGQRGVASLSSGRRSATARVMPSRWWRRHRTS